MKSQTDLLTTSQAASILEVHESSVKRWANEGKLNPVKTEGGHRRLSLDDLIDFAKTERPESTLIKFSPFEKELALAALAARERNFFQPFADLVVRICDTQHPKYLVAALKYLESAFEIPLLRSFDLGVTQAMRKVGNEWSSGLRTIGQEHRFTQKILDAVYGLRNDQVLLNPFETKEMDIPTPPKAVVGCSESNFHEVGALFVRMILETAGWDVTYLGANVPFTEYAELQKELNAKILAISFSSPSTNADARRCLSILAGDYRESSPYYVALGGNGIEPNSINLREWPFLGLKMEKDAEAFSAWSKTKAKKFLQVKENAI